MWVIRESKAGGGGFPCLRSAWAILGRHVSKRKNKGWRYSIITAVRLKLEDCHEFKGSPGSRVLLGEKWRRKKGREKKSV